jgi:hypothetical protein
MITKKDIIDTITLLKITYPNSLKDFKDDEYRLMIEIWYNDFKDTTKEEFNKAIQNIRFTNKFFPSVSDIKEQIAKMKTTDVSSAEDEWQEVLNAVRQYGSYREQEALKSLKPFTAKIVGYIGYLRICSATKEEQVWNKKEFVEEYNSLKDKGIIDLQLTSSESRLLNE